MKECPICWRCFEDSVNYCPGDASELKRTQPIDPLIANSYRLEKRLGEGGIAAVYLATRTEQQDQCAVKLLHDKEDQSPVARKRFEREASIVQRLSHPNIIRVFDYGEMGNGFGYLAMELLVGHSLEAEFRRSTVLPVAFCFELAEQICSAMAAAHAEGVIHRDLKPSNIFLHIAGDGREVVKILDFGLAKVISNNNVDRLTGSGIILGTPQYMSPEQCEGRNLDPRSDIYSLAIILYRALTGELPFNAASRIETIHKQLFNEPRELRTINPAVPAKLDTVIIHALAKAPYARFDSMQEFWQALSAARDEHLRELDALRLEAAFEPNTSERSSTRRMRRVKID